VTDCRSHRWFQLSLKSLFLLMLLVATFFVGYSLPNDRKAEAEKRASEAIGGKDDDRWVKASDSILAVRLRAKSDPVKPGEPIVVIATLRNVSDKPVAVLKPLGGPFTDSLPAGLAVRGPKGSVKYIGPAVQPREIAASDFLELLPGKEIKGEFAISSDLFSGADDMGMYSITYQYSTVDCQYAKSNRDLATSFPAIERLWVGLIPAVRLTVTKADPAVIKAEIKGLSDASEHARRNSAANLAMFGPAAKAAVDPLIRALSDKSDADLRMYAARALGAIGPDAAKALPALRHALADRADFGSRFVRKEAATALGRIGPKAAGVAVDDLLPLLGDDDLYVRRAASESLGLLEERAISGLLRSLEHGNPEVRYRATMALARMAEPARAALEKSLESESTLVRQGAAMAIASSPGHAPTKAVRSLIAHLQDKDPVVRRWIAAALARSVPDSKDATTALLAELKEDDEFALEVVILLSVRAADARVLEEMLKLLPAQPPAVRAQVIRATGLAHLDDQSARKAVPVLRDALKEPETGLRAAEALFRIASHDVEVRSQVDAYFTRHKLDGPYPGYRDDLRLALRNMDYEGPEFNFSAPEAVTAARRIFANGRFEGKTKSEVLAILGNPQALSAYARARYQASERQLVYCYATGKGGPEYTLHFKDGRVSSVEGDHFISDSRRAENP
jgi:HEAT repeat protein